MSRPTRPRRRTPTRAPRRRGAASRAVAGRARWSGVVTAVALIAVLALIAGLALAAALVGPATAAPASPATVVVSGVQSAAGTVEFFLAGRNLPDGAALSGAAITVRADGVTLPSTVREVTGTGADRDADPGATRAVVLVVDASGSMAGARISAARAAAMDYARAAPAGVWLGLVTVADRPTVVLAPTADRAAFVAAATKIQAKGGTALYDGIRAGVQLLDPQLVDPAAQPAAQPAAADFVERRVVVLSDGADTTSTMTADQLRAGLATTKVTVDAVAFGGQADRAQLTAVTGVTGGRVLPADDAAALRSVFRAMGAGLSAPVLVRATVPDQLAGRSTALQVQVLVGGVDVVARAPVAFGRTAGGGGRPTSFLGGSGGRTLTVTLVVLAVAVFLGTLLVVQPLFGGNAIQRRLRQLDRFTATKTKRPAGNVNVPAGDSPVLRAALAVSERALQSPGRRERTELALDRAGSSLRVAEWQLIRAGVSAAGAVVLVVLLPWWAGLPLGLFAGWFGSAQYLKMRAARRAAKFAEQLPEALQLVVGSLRSGFSLPQAIDSLVREGADPVAGELGRAIAETRLGGDLETALERVGQRNGSQDVEWLVMAIRIQKEVGGNLSEVLDTAVNTMRERGRLARHVRALSAEGRLSAMVLFGMPVVLTLFMFAVRRDYLRPLYTEPMGLLMMGCSVVMMGVGALWLRKLVQVVV